MNYLSTSNLSGIPNVSVAKFHKILRLLTKSTNSFPVLELPQELTGSKFYDSRITHHKSATIYLPEVDKLLNEYRNQVLPILFTVKFINIVNQNFALLNFSLKNDKLSFAINLYFKMANLPLMINDENIRKTLSYYLSNSSDSPGFSIIKNNSDRLNQLKQSAKTIEKNYLDKLRKVKYKRGKDDVTLAENANWYIKFANKKIEERFFEYFLVAKARTLQNLPDSAINDPRFRPSLTDQRWNEYDETIKREVAFYNKKFQNTPGYVSLDWRLVKAMVWTEVLAGPKGDPQQWSKYPLQIGRFSADPGYSVVKNGLENSDLITTQDLRTQIQKDVTGINNIKAGIAYLYTVAIRGKVSYRDVIEDFAVQVYLLKAGDTIDGIVKKLKTTKANIVKNTGLNETAVNQVKPGQEIKYQKAHSERYITGWVDWKTAVKSFNGGGDPEYMGKIERAYKIIVSRISK